MTIPFFATLNYGGYTSSLSFCASFPLDFWGILSSEFSCKANAIESWLSIAELQPRMGFSPNGVQTECRAKLA
jgi:hypothetical protein